MGMLTWDLGGSDPIVYLPILIVVLLVVVIMYLGWFHNYKSNTLMFPDSGKNFISSNPGRRSITFDTEALYFWYVSRLREPLKTATDRCASLLDAIPTLTSRFFHL